MFFPEQQIEFTFPYGIDDDSTSASKSEGRYVIGTMKKGEPPSTFGRTDSLYDANRQFNTTPGDRSVAFTFDTHSGAFIILMFENHACQDADIASEYDRLIRWAYKSFPSSKVPAISTVKRERDLSDPIERAAYDGFIQKKAVFR